MLEYVNIKIMGEEYTLEKEIIEHKMCYQYENIGKHIYPNIGFNYDLTFVFVGKNTRNVIAVNFGGVDEIADINTHRVKSAICRLAEKSPKLFSSSDTVIIISFWGIEPNGDVNVFYSTQLLDVYYFSANDNCTENEDVPNIKKETLSRLLYDTWENRTQLTVDLEEEL